MVILISIVVLFYLRWYLKNTEVAMAGSEHNLSGWAWNDTVGWISFNSTNTGATQDYGVNIDSTTGVFTGYAWSGVVGYIKFDPAGPYPAAPNNAVILNKSDGTISGWARLCSLATTPATCSGGNDGWVKMSNTSPAYGVTMDVNKNLHGYAWSENIGSISFNCAEGSASGGSICGTANYKVSQAMTLSESGNVYGWAWSANMGWTSFNRKDCDADNNGLSDGVPAGCPPAGTAIADYGVKIATSTGDFSGYAWSPNVGWLSFNRSDTGSPPADPYLSGSIIANYNKTTKQVTGWAKILSLGNDGWIKMAGDIGGSGPQTFNYTGSQQTWTVPTGVTSITVDMTGAAGGDSSDDDIPTTPGGKGGRVQATLPVTPGQTLYINVGGMGGHVCSTNYSDGGWNGGGGGGCATGYHIGGSGGGASDIRSGGTDLSNRIIVAGAGGGGGGDNDSYHSGNGGDAGSPNGLAGTDGANTSGGGGGTWSAGGGVGPRGGSGTAGGFGTGGLGGVIAAANGAGGGGGYYGGGGGNCTANGTGGGGGGGSSWTSGSSVTYTTGYQSGNGQVTISWSNTYGVTFNSGTSEFSGWAWNANDNGAGMGWLSFNCSNDSSCANSNYKVKLSGINSVPTAISLSAPNWNYANASQYGALKAYLNWTYNNANPGAAESAYQLIISTTNNPDSPVFDTGKCTDYNTPSANCKIGIPPTGVHNFPLDSSITGFTYNTPYYWWVSVWDNSDTQSTLTQYNVSPDTDNDDGNALTFTTYKHEFPAARFTWAPLNPHKAEETKFVDMSKIYFTGAPTTPVNCTSANCTWLWTKPADATINNSATSTPTIVFTTGGTVTLKVTDNDGYWSASSTLINIGLGLPTWKEVKPQ